MQLIFVCSWLVYAGSVQAHLRWKESLQGKYTFCLSVMECCVINGRDWVLLITDLSVHRWNGHTDLEWNSPGQTRDIPSRFHHPDPWVRPFEKKKDLLQRTRCQKVGDNVVASKRSAWSTTYRLSSIEMTHWEIAFLMLGVLYRI